MDGEICLAIEPADRGEFARDVRILVARELKSYGSYFMFAGTGGNDDVVDCTEDHEFDLEDMTDIAECFVFVG